MLGRKLLGVFLTAVLLLETMGLAMAAAPSTMADKLAEVERTAYGVPQTGALLDRVNKLEKDFEGTHEPTESVMQRVDKLFDMMFKNENGPSLVTRMNAIEWGIKQSVSMEPIQKRVSDMEIAMTGAPSEGTYKARIATLAAYAFGDKEIPLAQIQVPANTLVKVSLVTPVNAKNLKVGDRIEIKSEEDVIENGRLIFAKGAPGYGEVTKVKRAGNFGRDAEVQIDFKVLRTMDGTDASMLLGEESKEKMQSMAFAAGASIAGIALLGPIGIIGGAFVKGKNIDLPAGTELYIQTAAPMNIYGLEAQAPAEGAK
ncbi:MAG: hypothetical protein J6Z82_07000 [Schwartzia sp.]|nr:hypothetical protein [Schwartzia sp. (in: firmicutes)]